MLGIVLVTGIILLSGAAAIGQSNPWLSLSLLFIGIAISYLAHHWFFHRILGEAMEDIIITNHRIVWMVEKLYQLDEQRQIPLDQIRGVEAVKTGFFQNFFGYGSIWFDTGGTTTKDENAIIHQVPQPNVIAQDINALLEKQ